MIQKRLIFLLLLISFKISFADDECSSSYEQLKKESCQKISGSSSGIYCDFVDGQCKDWYKECAEYHPTSGFDSSVCNKINPSNPLKRCYTDGDQCKEKDKECSELSEELCPTLYSNNKRCVFKDGKCEEHSNSCTGLDRSKCESNIPISFLKRCYLEGSTCEEKDRTCSELIDYKDYVNTGLPCSSVTNLPTSKVCINNDDNTKCIELYSSCQPLNQNDCGNSQLMSFSKAYKCVWDTQKNSCEKIQKLCSEYKNEDGLYCSSYTTNFPSYKRRL